MVSAAADLTLLLLSDGRALTCGMPGKCTIPALENGVSYIQVRMGQGLKKAPEGTEDFR